MGATSVVAVICQKQCLTGSIVTAITISVSATRQKVSAVLFKIDDD
jgi:hypothetical protein